MEDIRDKKTVLFSLSHCFSAAETDVQTFGAKILHFVQDDTT